MFAQTPHTVSVEVWAWTGRLSTYLYLMECCSAFTNSVFLISNTCFDLRAFSNRLVKNLLFWGTCFRFTLWFPTTVAIFNNIHIVGNSVSSSTPKSWKSRLSCSATKIWQVNLRFSLWLWRSRYSVIITWSGSSCNCIYSV